ncbi:Protein CBG14183 [Caenorhabditis briggsae]|uniref:Protein CBG14183 n=1 Tax=Caenorhabditis briggsae TaxID=6238 RepID=A8XJG5_CAEBR|nr:Protein CBG14183 [Caenorhabditis briggsae]CAP32790.2 Protein CBG14183 [Caenorhabditis briggsae]
MTFSVPPNVLYMLFCFVLMDLINTITVLIFPTLAATINEMNNHTLKSHYGIQPTDANIAILNSMITTSATVGMVFSLFFIMPIAETKGRKLAVTYFRFIITLVCSFCQLLSALTQATELFILGQILNGLQIPLRAFVTLMYITECAPDKYRGTFRLVQDTKDCEKISGFASSAVIFSDVIGQLIMFSVGSPSALGKQNTWFIFPLVVIISSIVNFGMAARLPESPKWLVRQNRLEEATQAIEFYQGDSCNLNDVLTSYIKEKNLTQEDKISFRQVWENDTMREALKVLCSVSLFLILDSGAVQGTYTILLHTTAGYTVQETMNIKLILTILFFPTRFIGTYLLDALGRRPVMAIAGVIVYSKTWLMLITQIIIYFVGPSLLTKILCKLSLIYLVTQMIPDLGVEALSNSTFATGVASLGILFISELFPPSARTTVAQALIMVTMIIDLPLIASFPIVYAIFGPGYFFIHIFTQVFFGTYLYRHMPETKGRAVYDIIEAMDQDVASRTATFIEEKTPLIRKRVSLSFPSVFQITSYFFSPQHLPSNETAYSTLLGHGKFEIC